MPRTVLIVEDVEACADTLEIAFSGMRNIEVVTVIRLKMARADGGRRTRSGSDPSPDLQMDGMDGFELIERVRSHVVALLRIRFAITDAFDPMSRGSGWAQTRFFRNHIRPQRCGRNWSSCLAALASELS